MVKSEVADLENKLVAMLPADALPIEEKVLSPDWNLAEEWSDQIPVELRDFWNDLSLESKLVAVIVGAQGIRPWDIE